MVSLVWFILSLCKLCGFSWLVMFIEFGIISLLLLCAKEGQPVLSRICASAAFFAFLKYFCGLTISGWWLFAAPFIFSLLLLIPGGVTLFCFLFARLQFIALPTWVWVLCLTADVLLLAFRILSRMAEKKEETSLGRPMEIKDAYASPADKGQSSASYSYDASYTAPSVGEKLGHIKEMLFGKKSGKADLQQVQFSAITPSQMEKGKRAVLHIAMYEEANRAMVEKLINSADIPVKESLGSSQEVSKGTLVTVRLTAEDIGLDESETQTWQGRFLNFTFVADLPKTYAKSDIFFTATVYFNNVIATKLRFTADCSSPARTHFSVHREDILTAFMSYASQDRARAAALIMGMKKARPDMDIFFDVESLRSGEAWEDALRQEIEARDILFLCWSPNAKASKWVEMEWQYALQNKGIDAIEPIPLVSPAVCPPPEELEAKHFNDKYLLYIPQMPNFPDL